ncbi:MAG: zinc dependent phospholipase C family protein [Eubacteriales bacterium]
MASWMTHLRIADRLLDEIGDLSLSHFVVGNIAPDSGVPVNGDWNTFTPPGKISHWILEGVPNSERAEKFKERYLAKMENTNAASFYLGYYTHLLIDYMWGRDIASSQRKQYAAELEQNPEFIWEIKRGINGLDYLFYKENPDFKAFSILQSLTSFSNKYLDYFSETAFENKIVFITDFYKNYNDENEKESPYITKLNVDKFIENAINEIRPKVLTLLEFIKR